MKNFLFQVKINYKRIIFRNLRFLFFSMAMPIGFYLLFTQVMNQTIPDNILKNWNVTYLISMIVYSMLISSVFAVSNTLLEDRGCKLDLLVELSAVSKLQYYGSMIIVFLSLNILGACALEITAYMINHIQVSMIHLVELILLLPLVSFPLVLLGILISLAGSGNTVNVLCNLAVFPMAILSGLWWPLDTMPNWMQHTGKLLPTYHAKEFLNEFVQGQHFNFNHFSVLLAWSILLAGILKGVVMLTKKREVQSV
ncbi:ABC transporter permease [Enterococcus sp.]|jgi:ABC-2 type transport system permease protein|uniref:ABC transporter permease n=1 Tax=Enterococcus sp. TaxID=35783 RepID=UPI0025C6649C|nr:ABC transporter permease [Enterococcus sp.]